MLNPTVCIYPSKPKCKVTSIHDTTHLVFVPFFTLTSFNHSGCTTNTFYPLCVEPKLIVTP